MNTDAHPEDLWTTDGIDPASLERLGQRSLSVTGIPQRLHTHPAGDRCLPTCRLVTL